MSGTLGPGEVVILRVRFPEGASEPTGTVRVMGVAVGTVVVPVVRA